MVRHELVPEHTALDTGAPQSCRRTSGGPGHDDPNASPAHVTAHFLTGLVGTSAHVPVRGGRLALGELQRIVLLELEGPWRREIELRRLADA